MESPNYQVNIKATAIRKNLKIKHLPNTIITDSVEDPNYHIIIVYTQERPYQLKIPDRSGLNQNLTDTIGIPVFIDFSYNLIVDSKDKILGQYILTGSNSRPVIKLNGDNITKNNQTIEFILEHELGHKAQDDYGQITHKTTYRQVEDQRALNQADSSYLSKSCDC